MPRARAPSLPGRPLDADTPIRMGGISAHLRQDAVLDRCHDAASGYAHRTVGVQLLHGHGPTPSFPQLNLRNPTAKY